MALDDHLLGLLDAHQHLEPVGVGAAPDGRVDHDVHGGVVLIRDDLRPFAPQPDHPLGDRVLDDLLKQAFEKVTEARLGKRARYQLNPLLGSRDEKTDAFLGGRLHGLRVEALATAR